MYMHILCVYISKFSRVDNLRQWSI